MNKSIFITSTGTEIGKTYCTVRIIKELVRRNYRTQAFKPILSGFRKENIEESDSFKILKAQKKKVNLKNIKAITPWIFNQPIAPSLASQKEHKSLIYQDVLKWCNEKKSKDILTIFEGAGGVFVPIEKKKTMLNLIIDTNSSVVLVVGNYLGSISHTLSVINNLEFLGINIINVIVNQNKDTEIDIKDTINLLKSSLDRKIKLRKILNNNSKNKIFKDIVDDILIAIE